MKIVINSTICICTLALVSCTMGVGKSTVKELRTDPITGEQFTVITDTVPSFWKSENQEMAFNTMREDIRASKELAKIKIDAIDRARMERASIPLSVDARAYANALDIVVINNIKTDVDVSDIPMPRNMADSLGNQSVALAQIGAGALGALFGVDIPIWLTGGSGRGGSMTYMEKVNIGGDSYSNGSVRKDSYDLGGYQSAFSNSIPGGSVSEDNDVYNGNSQSSNAGGDGDTISNTPLNDNDSLF